MLTLPAAPLRSCGCRIYIQQSGTFEIPIHFGFVWLFSSAQLHFCSVKTWDNCSFVPLLTLCPPPPPRCAVHPSLVIFFAGLCSLWFQLNWMVWNGCFSPNPTAEGLGWFGFFSTELSLDFVIRNEPSPGMRMGCGCRNLQFPEPWEWSALPASPAPGEALGEVH